MQGSPFLAFIALLITRWYTSLISLCLVHISKAGPIVSFSRGIWLHATSHIDIQGNNIDEVILVSNAFSHYTEVGWTPPGGMIIWVTIWSQISTAGRHDLIFWVFHLRLVTGQSSDRLNGEAFHVLCFAASVYYLSPVSLHVGAIQPAPWAGNMVKANRTW